jgi:ubiquinone/menaquinone biosynthesis C-methylase UbiE
MVASGVSIHWEGNVMRLALEQRMKETLQEIGVCLGQTVLDFGCGYGAYTIPAAQIVGEQGRIYALDKDAKALALLKELIDASGLTNIDIVDTTGTEVIPLPDESVDVVLLFDVLHSFYFPLAEERSTLLSEIYRVMKPEAFLLVSVWPNLLEADIESELQNSAFREETAVSETVIDGTQKMETRRISKLVKRRAPGIKQLVRR